MDAYLAALGGLALVLGLASRKIRDLPISEPLAALLVGVLLGPVAVGALGVAQAERDMVLFTASHLVLGLSLMAVALRFPLRQVRDHLAPTALLTVAAMVAMAGISAGLSAFVLSLPVASAWLLGAALAPTDPVLASNIVSGAPAERDLPLRLRVLLSIESAANDALAAPLVLLGIAALQHRSLVAGAAEAVGMVVIGATVGGLLGLGAGKAVVWADRHRDIEHSAFLALTLSLTALVLGAAELVGGEGLMAVFVGGLAYNHAVTASERSEEWEVQEAINRFLVLPIFTLLGVTLPWDSWVDLGPRGPVFVAAILLLRRLPVAFLLQHPLRLRGRDAAFVGWFGPIGVAALFYLSQAGEHGVQTEQVWAAGSLVIVTSVVLHGLTATPARRVYARAAA